MMPKQCMSKLWSQISVATRLYSETCMGYREKVYPQPTPALEEIRVIAP